MNCKECFSLQSQYIDGDLSPDAVARVQAHLAECSACRHSYAAMESLVKSLHTMDDIPVPENLAEEVLAAVKRGPQAEKRIFRLPRILSSWQTYSVAAACMLLFTVFYTQTNDRFAMTNDSYVYTVAPSDRQEMMNPRMPAMMPEMPAATNDPTASATPAGTTPAQRTTETAALYTPQTPTAANTESAAPRLRSATAQNTNTATERSLDVAAPEAASDSTSPFSAFTGAPTPASLDTQQENVKVPARSTTTSATPAPAKGSNGGSTSKASTKTYSTVSSLVKRSITFVVDDTAAERVFQNAKSDGVNAVRKALYNAGIDFSTRESVVAEYASQYNALVNEANALAQRIANGGSTSLKTQLAQKENEMQALKNECSSPVLYIAYE